MKRSFKNILQVAFWLIYFFLVAIVMFAATFNETMTFDDRRYYFVFTIGVAIIPPMLSYYFHYTYLFPTYLKKKKLSASVFYSILLSSLGVLVGFIFIWLGDKVATGCVQTGFPYAFGFTFTLSSVFGGLALIWKGFLTWFEEINLKNELIEKNHQMELALVKSQLDPHFLFNTINNIDILIEKKPSEASLYLKKLSDIMRFMLYQTKGEQIHLSEELAYIEKYIELQKIRTGNQNYVQYKLEGKVNGQKIAPMVFIPFIENAFKHAKNKKVDRAVDIAIKVEAEQILFKCQNKFDPHLNNTNGYNGLGNELIQKRLQILYPQRHQLEVEKEEDLYKVELNLQYGKV